jgi:hypothetical protein
MTYTLSQLANLLGMTDAAETHDIVRPDFIQACFSEYREGIGGNDAPVALPFTLRGVLSLVQAAETVVVAAAHAGQQQSHEDGLPGMPWTATRRPLNSAAATAAACDWPAAWHAARFVWRLDRWVDNINGGWPRDTADRGCEMARCAAVLRYLHEIHIVWPSRCLSTPRARGRRLDGSPVGAG